jgi:hypothetical protein
MSHALLALQPSFKYGKFCFMMGVSNFVGNGKDIRCLHHLHQVGSKQKQSP